MIRQVELELTTACNAACPQCSRNFYGGPKWPTVPSATLNLNWMREKLPIDFLRNLEIIRLCGTYGDPCTHPDLLNIVSWLKQQSRAKIFISTNGGMKSVHWWSDLARVLDQDDEVIFGIDGLESTNHLHRRHVRFSKVINNMRSFIKKGGQATWQFIVFAHNQHEIESARQTSASLGCKNFIIKLTTRFVNKQHELVDRTPVLGERQIYFLQPPTSPDWVNKGYHQFSITKQSYATIPVDCIAKRLHMIYISADGFVFPCGFLADRMYGFEAENHPDYKRLQDLFALAGGIEAANLNHTELDDIVHGPWFAAIEQSWSDHHRLERCAHQCGKNNELTTQVYDYMRGINN